ncbi:MAG: substrate-binding domain-containing protein [Gemmatimonadota bacterium]
MASSSPLRSTVRTLRTRAGWSQSELGDRVGLTRQSLAAIESGKAVPSTDVALRLAAAFGVPVEELFRLRDAPGPVERAERSGLGGALPGRVRLATVSGRTWAYGLDLADPGGMDAADGMGEVAADGRVLVRPLAERPGRPDLVVAGCDPAFGLVRERLRREHGLEVLWLRTGSRAALDALSRGAVHVAGIHLRDPASGVYNGPWVEREVPFRTTRVAFATWEQAILVGRGNPLGIRGIADLARPDMRFVNREPGSGSRALVESALAEHGLDAEAIPGFLETSADRHETVARAIASGVAQAGVAIRAVGHALELGAVPLAIEPYELVVPDHFLDLPAVDALLSLLRRPAMREQVEALTGYDAASMGVPL